MTFLALTSILLTIGADPGTIPAPLLPSIELHVDMVPSRTSAFQPGDELFFRVSLTNTGRSPVPIPATIERAAGTLRVQLHAENSPLEGYSYSFPGQDPYGEGGAQPILLSPGETFVAAYLSLLSPPRSRLQEDFWRRIAAARVEVSVAIKERLETEFRPAIPQRERRRETRRGKSQSDSRVISKNHEVLSVGGHSRRSGEGGRKQFYPRPQVWWLRQSLDVFPVAQRSDLELTALRAWTGRLSPSQYAQLEQTLASGTLRDRVHLLGTQRRPISS